MSEPYNKIIENKVNLLSTSVETITADNLDINSRLDEINSSATVKSVSYVEKQW